MWHTSPLEARRVYRFVVKMIGDRAIDDVTLRTFPGTSTVAVFASVASFDGFSPDKESTFDVDLRCCCASERVDGPN